MRKIIVDTQTPQTVQAYLSQNYTCLPPAILRNALKRRDIKRNGQRIGANEQVYNQDQLWVYIDEKYFSLPVLWEDSHLLAVEKRQGLPCEEVQRLYETYFLCHRLDTQTGGILLLAKDEETLKTMEELFRNHKIQKTYQCIVTGKIEKKEADLKAYLIKDAEKSRVRIVSSPQKGALSIHTSYKLKQTEGKFSLLEVTLHTGRTHQIRAHLASVGLPLVGDEKYGNFAVNRETNLHAQQLWAVQLRFPSLTGALSPYSNLTIFSLPQWKWKKQGGCF